MKSVKARNTSIIQRTERKFYVDVYATLESSRGNISIVWWKCCYM